MDQKSCCECKYSSSENRYKYLYDCYTCYESVCTDCKDKHIQRYEGKHCITIGFGEHYYWCSKHKQSFDSFCTNCSELLCNVCIGEIHRCHTFYRLVNIPHEIATELRRNAQDELQSVRLHNENVRNQIIQRERYLDELRSRASEIEYKLKKQSSRIDGLLFQRRNDVKQWIWTQLENTPETSELMEEMKILKINKEAYSELERHLSRTVSENTFTDFAKRYNGFCKDMKKVNLHQIPGETFPELSIDFQEPTEKELLDMLFQIRIRCKGQMSSATTKDKDMKATSLDQEKTKDHMITQLKAEIREKEEELSTMKSTIEQMSKSAHYLNSAIQTNNSSGILQFEKPLGLKNYPEIEKHWDSYHQQIKQLDRFMLDMKNRSVQSTVNQIKPKSHESEYSERHSLEKAESHLQKVQREMSELKKSLESLTNVHNSTKRELQSVINEKEDLKTRLSQVAGAKLVSGNSSIADLGDKYRPTKIAEMYSDLYDSEWTDAIDEITKLETNKTEEVIVRHLFIVLKETFRACQEVAQRQMDKLVQDMFFKLQDKLPNERKTKIVEMKQLKDARRGIAYDVGLLLAKNLFSDKTLKDGFSKYKEVEESLLHRVVATKYAERCIMICWFMVVQDPEMYLDDDLKTGSKVNKDTYREYTKSGEKIVFSVWPALYLHINGPLLVKGVAQCAK